METIKPKLLSNPRDTANIFSILFFTWTLPLFKKGYTKILEIEDVCRPLHCDRSKIIGENLQSTWQHQLSGKTLHPSLLKAIATTFWREYLLLGFLCLINDVIIRLVQPQLLRQFLLYFKEGSNVSHMTAIAYASGMVILNGIGVFAINQLFITGYHNGLKVRVAVCSMIYRKALKLSHAALENIAPSKVVNLISNDVSRFDSVSMFLNSMWTAPLMVVVIGYLLWIEVRWAGMIGLAVVFVIVPIQSYTGKMSSKYRYQTALRTDERVRFMDEIISGVHVIKMYAWEQPFTKFIALARRMELKVVRKNSYIRALYMTFAMFTTRIALFCTMLSIFVIYGKENITAAKVFVVSSYFTVIAQTLSQMFVRGVAEIAEGLVAFERIQNFLETEEKSSLIQSVKHSADGKLDVTNVDENFGTRKISIYLRDMSARWISSEDLPFTLNNINLEIIHGKLIGIVGPTGSGKSSLLQALLRELPVETGSLHVYGSISYACQEPWLFASSVRQNILFSEQMDRKRYDMVVRACALERDFEQLEYFDRTLVGERGASLSGGQKARINLARAMYRKADIYLFDDPLSAVDTHVGLHLFNECIGPKGKLAKQKATRILVTHQVHHLKNVDWLVIMQNGKIVAQGHPTNLISNAFDLKTFTEATEQHKFEENEIQRRRKMSRISTRSASITSLCSNYDGIRRESEFDAGLIESLQYYEENVSDRIQGSSNFRKYFENGASHANFFILFLLFALTQLTASGADFWVSFWTSQEDQRTHQFNSIMHNMTSDTIAVQRHNISIFSTEACVFIYSALIAAIFFVAISRSIVFYNVCLKASQTLHDNMFKGIISTTMRFFHLNPSGRILNRFARDMGSTDELLPRVLLDAIQTNLNMFGAIILTAAVNPLFLIPVLFAGLIFLVARNVYLQTSKNIKRLEGITRSPVFTHLSVSLNGLSTIRAFNAEQILIDEFDNQLDTHTACWYMFISTSSAFGFALDVICFVLVFVVIFTFLLFDTGASGDKVGLAITQSMTMTGLLQWGIRHSVEVTNQLISVERIIEYSRLEAEQEPVMPKDVNKLWPLEGRIEFRNVTYKYFYESEPVLRKVSFMVQPMEKIGIVGRTGAGKSSLIEALFRMAHVKGEIFIDEIDTSTISLHVLRSRIAIIPQDPVLFSGTLRMNLDPFEEYGDIDIWDVLEEVEMRYICTGPEGLQLSVLAHGGNFSVGQRQLLCLARAILRKNRILVLDEATANVDPQTDLLIQKTIRTRFADCTVLTVAHRLHTVIDSNRILVMDAGRLAEFDTPYKLLTQRKGIFKDMVHALGPLQMEDLLNKAQQFEH